MSWLLPYTLLLFPPGSPDPTSEATLGHHCAELLPISLPCEHPALPLIQPCLQVLSQKEESYHLINSSLSVAIYLYRFYFPGILRLQGTERIPSCCAPTKETELVQMSQPLAFLPPLKLALTF